MKCRLTDHSPTDALSKCQTENASIDDRVYTCVNVALCSRHNLRVLFKIVLKNLSKLF